MPLSPKIATCCYCGTKAALILGGEGTRHELSCSACGAPLHALKRLRPFEAPARQPARMSAAPVVEKRMPKKKKKRRKSRARWFLEEAFDLVEDIFD